MFNMKFCDLTKVANGVFMTLIEIMLRCATAINTMLLLFHEIVIEPALSVIPR